jgi:hypothetical protein
LRNLRAKRKSTPTNLIGQRFVFFLSPLSRPVCVQNFHELVVLRPFFAQEAAIFDDANVREEVFVIFGKPRPPAATQIQASWSIQQHAEEQSKTSRFFDGSRKNSRPTREPVFSTATTEPQVQPNQVKSSQAIMSDKQARDIPSEGRSRMEESAPKGQTMSQSPSQQGEQMAAKERGSQEGFGLGQKAGYGQRTSGVVGRQKSAGIGTQGLGQEQSEAQRESGNAGQPP